MNILVILIEMAVFAAIFTAVIFSYFRGGRKYSCVRRKMFDAPVHGE